MSTSTPIERLITEWTSTKSELDIDEVIASLPTVLLRIVYDYLPIHWILLEAAKAADPGGAESAVTMGAELDATDHDGFTILMLVILNADTSVENKLAIMSWIFKARMERASKQATLLSFPAYAKYCWKNCGDFLDRTNSRREDALAIATERAQPEVIVFLARQKKRCKDIGFAEDSEIIPGSDENKWDVTPLVRISDDDEENKHPFEVVVENCDSKAVSVVMNSSGRNRDEVNFRLLRAAVRRGDNVIFNIVKGESNLQWTVGRFKIQGLLKLAVNAKSLPIFDALITPWRAHTAHEWFRLDFFNERSLGLINLAIAKDQLAIIKIISDSLKEADFSGQVLTGHHFGVLSQAFYYSRKEIIRYFLFESDFSLSQLGISRGDGEHLVNKSSRQDIISSALLYSDPALLSEFIDKIITEIPLKELVPDLRHVMVSNWCYHYHSLPDSFPPPPQNNIRVLLRRGVRLSSQQTQWITLANRLLYVDLLREISDSKEARISAPTSMLAPSSAASTLTPQALIDEIIRCLSSAVLPIVLRYAIDDRLIELMQAIIGVFTRRQALKDLPRTQASASDLRSQYQEYEDKMISWDEQQKDTSFVDFIKSACLLYLLLDREGGRDIFSAFGAQLAKTFDLFDGGDQVSQRFASYAMHRNKYFQLSPERCLTDRQQIDERQRHGEGSLSYVIQFAYQSNWQCFQCSDPIPVSWNKLKIGLFCAIGRKLPKKTVHHSLLNQDCVNEISLSAYLLGGGAYTVLEPIKVQDVDVGPAADDQAFTH